jgi:L-fuculose-phosphate aldolase
MKRRITERDLEEIVRAGNDATDLGPNTVLTAAARGFLRGYQAGREAGRHGAMSAPAGRGSGEPPPRPSLPNSRSSKSALEAFFSSPHAQHLKAQICDVGRRLWQRGFVEGNGGNLAIRVGRDLAICTPTLISKGAMRPEDMCLVDLRGNQLLGSRKCTSEILMHLQIMNRQPRAVATCHGHPPHATAFAVMGEAPPSRVLPEYELICSVGLAPYATPGSAEVGRRVASLSDRHDTILMANHGVVAWSPSSLEEAYWRIEVVEMYCRTIAIARQLGRPIHTFNDSQMKALQNIKKRLGYLHSRRRSRR